MNDQFDPGVVPLVSYFNSHGLRTIMSCQGHNETTMSMFWIRFAASVTEEDIVEFQRKHLNRLGGFPACGRFSERILASAAGVWRGWEYTAATVHAADCDLQKWQADDSRN